MLISGFTIVRNARSMGYPVVQAIRSILPIVDEYVVGVGQSDDDSRSLIESIGDPKVRLFDSQWDTARQVGGRILSEKTNEAMARCRGEWCFCLQADEVVHERDLPLIADTCERTLGDPRVEGLLFRYLHFYGSYGVLATARNWYRQEVRVVRRAANVLSVGDAQSFLVGDRKPRVVWSCGDIYHYGHVKPPRTMGEKQRQMLRWWGAAAPPVDEFRFRQIYGLRRFTGSHPSVMSDLIAAQDWNFEPRLDPRQWKPKDWKNMISDLIEAVVRHRIDERRMFTLID
jgi:hypothetical protein